MSQFPEGFAWGAATSAHQTEGNNTNSDWWHLEHQDNFPTVEPSRDACDSYHRYGEDIELLASAGLNSYRFSIEWARIEPAPGEFSTATLDHYQRIIDVCLERGVQPTITLHHFTNPAWVRALGAWDSPQAVELFGRYAEQVLGRLQGVARVCTINEPNIIANSPNITAWWASLESGSATSIVGRPDAKRTEVLIAAHQRAVDIARANGLAAGLTLGMTAYATDGTDEAGQLVAAHRQLDEDVYIEGARHGDFLGVQAYTQLFANSQGILPPGHDLSGPSARQTLTKWNYYPSSIGECLRRAHELAPELPLLVTENGIATDNDDERIAYTTEALGSVHAAISDSIPVSGYFHWSLLDNFEWVAGYGPTFGLVAVDRDTFARTPKPSLEWLGRVAKGNALPH